MNKLEAFLKQVETNTCTENMTLDLMSDKCFTIWGPPNGYSTRDLEKLAKALASGNCKSGLSINLYADFMHDKGVKALAEGLKSPKRPPNLSLNLGGNLLTDEGLRYIVDALVAGPATPGVEIKIWGLYAVQNGCGCTNGANEITDKGAKIFAEGLEKMIVNGNCPKNLIFDFSYTDINNEGGGAIAEALESAMKKNADSQYIYLKLPSQISPFIRERIEKALEELRNRPDKGVIPKFPAIDTLFAAKAIKKPEPTLLSNIPLLATRPI